MRLSVVHHSNYAYEPAAQRVSLRLKLFPSVFEGQSVESWNVSINGDALKPEYMSAYGDEVAVWHSSEEITGAAIIAEGVVLTEDKSGIVKGLPKKPPSAIFTRSTDLTEPDAAIIQLAQKHTKNDQLETIHDLAGAIRSAVTYTSGVTGSTTTAAEAMAGGEGVCQDHAHIMIAACRTLDIPTRYVTGYLQAAEDESALLETHAWVEAHIANFGWVGIDVSNGISPTDHYVRIACGLDADDATPIKGHVVGGSEISLTAEVSVADSQQQ